MKKSIVMEQVFIDSEGEKEKKDVVQ